MPHEKITRHFFVDYLLDENEMARRALTIVKSLKLSHYLVHIKLLVAKRRVISKNRSASEMDKH